MFQFNYMRSLFLSLILLASTATAQDFAGTFSYVQVLNGQEQQVDVQLDGAKAHIHRSESGGLHYVVQADGNMLAWLAHATQATQTKVPAALPMKAMSKGKSQLMSGLSVQDFSVELPDGSKLTGWYAPALQADYNALIAPIQGSLWGVLPGLGLPVEWKVVDAKGNTLLEVRLVDYTLLNPPAAAFVLPEGRKLVDYR